MLGTPSANFAACEMPTSGSMTGLGILMEQRNAGFCLAGIDDTP